MPPTFVFIRHGHRERHSKVLSDHGKATLPATAQWLQAHALAPDLVLTTKELRTHETARLLQAHMGGQAAPSRALDNFFANETGLRARIVAASALQPTGIVWLVGHGANQRALQNLFGAKVVIPRDNHAAAIAFQQADGGFNLVAWFAGSP